LEVVFLDYPSTVKIVHDRQCFLIKLVPNTMRIISKKSTVTPNFFSLFDIS
jgi:hypothetical protein